MAEVLNPKVEASGLVDIALLGISKSTTERLLAPVIGNATPTSGAVKLVVGSIVQGKMGKMGKAVGGGLVIDGIEDLVSAFLGDTLKGSNSTPNSEAW